tara:strand:- start:2286 stop:3272 length:987 start_codon:yes stop_codon:yes gene_type:complete
MNKKLIINVGCARSGTTAMDALFDKLPNIETPYERKEIQAFSNTEISLNDYLKFFKNNASEFFFESSPPYVHAGIDKFSKIIKNIKAISQAAEVKVIFNLRSLAKRAFSHYWHDISRHHSLYGVDWRVRSSLDLNRYKILYSDSFFEALAKDYDKFLPDIMGMIALTGKELGWDNVQVILQKQLDSGINQLCSELTIPVENIKSPRTQGCRAPCFLRPGEYRVVDDTGSNSLVVHENTILRIGYDGTEILDGNKYQVNDILESSEQWTKSLSYRKVSSIFGRYFGEQSRQLKSIPEHIFLTNLNVDRELFKSEDLHVKDEVAVEYQND